MKGLFGEARGWCGESINLAPEDRRSSSSLLFGNRAIKLANEFEKGKWEEEGKEIIEVVREKIKEEIRYHENKLKELEEEYIKRVKEYRDLENLERTNIYGEPVPPTSTESRFYSDFLFTFGQRKSDHEFMIKKLNKRLEAFNNLSSEYLLTPLEDFDF